MHIRVVSLTFCFRCDDIKPVHVCMYLSSKIVFYRVYFDSCIFWLFLFFPLLDRYILKLRAHIEKLISFYDFICGVIWILLILLSVLLYRGYYWYTADVKLHATCGLLWRTTIWFQSVHRQNVLLPPSRLNEKFVHYTFFFQINPRGLSFSFEAAV